MLQLDEATSAMSRGSSDSSSSASTVVGDHTIPYIALPKSSTSSPFLSVIPPTNPSRPETALNAPNASSPLPAGFPAHLPLSYPARTGVAVLNTKSKPVGWDCGPATISLFEAKYGPGANGPLTRDVQPGISGGVSKPSINWRLYGDGRLGAESAREQTEPEAAERGLPRAPSPPPTRRIAQLKSSSSNRRASVKDEPTVEQARAIWMQYYAAVEEFRTLRLPSVMGPWEPACRCPFAEEGGE
ncbi:hypothetical protein CALVIDRAFT_534716 [Calocera viscosa TUFC12733]|uniref:Uncharacterized protein n=1 Tax=Calocera viscosa (strain TUFC12733) TaxID=1330018 RepID=A0A167PW04_CALVF|nr:hypothetical protein CALVIDRAFT_534716 [Calocera viscosa TUFC12733]